jgi:CRP-like cAMP-binding protein
VVVREDDPGTELYFLLRGSIAILKRDVAGKQRPVGELRAPTLLGQIGVVDRSRRTATGVAASEVIVAVLDPANFQRLVRETHPRGRALRRLLLSSLTQQLVTANERLRDLLAARSNPAAAGRAGLGEAFLRASGVLEGSTEDAPISPDPPTVRG